MREEKGLPKGWELARLGDVCSFEYGKALKKVNRRQDGGFPVVGSNGCVGFHDEFLVNGPGVVIGRKGAAGEVSFVSKNFWPIDTTYFLRLNNKSSLRYFYYLLKSLRLKQFEKSTAIPGLNRNNAYEQIVGIPPLPEQHRIVAKTEELFSSLDKGVESLKTAQQQLKVYRQAVLKWAFEGKLTNRNVVDGELPKGWNNLKLKDITTEKDGLRRGPFGSAIKKEIFVSSGYKVYEQGNAINDDPYRGNYFITESKYQELGNFRIIPGDLIVSCSGVTLGRISEIPKDAQPGVINQALLRIRLKHDLIFNKYFILYFRSSFFQKKIFDQSQGTAMPNLVGIKDFKEIELLVPSLPDQKTVVAEIESRLSVCDKIEESIEQSLKQAESLRQSILKKAFEGQLVPQDPSDEPARVLLERIRRERAETLPTKAKRRPSKGDNERL